MGQDTRSGIPVILLADRYGAFSVGYSQLDDLIRYVDHQEAHHKTKTFQDEYRELLRKYNVDFDERYVWD